MWQKESSEFDPVFVNDGHPISPITTGQRVRTIVRNWRTLTFETPFVNRPSRQAPSPRSVVVELLWPDVPPGSRESTSQRSVRGVCEFAPDHV